MNLSTLYSFARLSLGGRELTGPWGPELRRIRGDMPLREMAAHLDRTECTLRQTEDGRDARVSTMLRYLRAVDGPLLRIERRPSRTPRQRAWREVAQHCEVICPYVPSHLGWRVALQTPLEIG